MYARLTLLEVDLLRIDLDTALATFEREVLPQLREMPAFVRLAEEVNADTIVFQRYYSFGHEGSDVFSSKDVASPAHPEHAELQAILADPILQSPRVLQTFMAQLIDRPAC